MHEIVDKQSTGASKVLATLSFIEETASDILHLPAVIAWVENETLKGTTLLYERICHCLMFFLHGE